MNRRYSTILLICLIIIGILGGPLYESHRADAQVLKFAGILGNCLKQVLIGFIIQIAIPALLAAIFSVPTIDIGSFSDAVKEYIKDPLARCIARGFFDEAVGQMLDVVRHKGRDGAASFVRNWRNFETSAQYRGEDVMRGIIANTEMCDFFKQDLSQRYGLTTSSKISLSGINIRLNNLNPFTLRGKCPLPASFNLEDYTTDPMGNGGVAAFTRMLDPAGNPLGESLMIATELAAQRAAEVNADLNDAQAGRGHTSQVGSPTTGSGGTTTTGTTCVADATCGASSVCSNYTCKIGTTDTGIGCNTSFPCPVGQGTCSGVCSAPSGNTTATTNEPSCLIRGPNGKCIRYADIRSPGSYIADTVQSQIHQELAWVTNVDELKELVINYIWTRLANRLQDLGADEQPPTYNNAETGAGPAVTAGPNPFGSDCVDVRGDAAYDKYEGASRAAIAAAFPTDTRLPLGMSELDAILAICAKWPGPGTCTPHVPAGGDDELVVHDPGAPPQTPAMPDISVDVLTSSGDFWANSIAACITQ